jgi:hypothetical protein
MSATPYSKVNEKRFVPYVVPTPKAFRLRSKSMDNATTTTSTPAFSGSPAASYIAERLSEHLVTPNKASPLPRRVSYVLINFAST